MNATLSPHDLDLILRAEHADPFGVLGLHSINGNQVVRAFRPDAKTLTVIDRADPKTKFVAQRIADEGVFEAIANGQTDRFDYLLEVTNWAGQTTQVADPYSFGPLLGELDMHL
jgi:1,4-alpha-glucan branching enzyme